MPLYPPVSGNHRLRARDSSVAEIPVRRKEGRNIWPLLVGLIVLAAVLWFVVARRNTTNTTATIPADTAAAASGKVTRDSAGGMAVEKKVDTPLKADTPKKAETPKKVETRKRRSP